MQEAVYRVLTLVSALVEDVPIGTNLGLLHLLWMLLSGKALLTRGAIIPGLSAVGLSAGAVRRAWAALGHGSWTSHRLVKQWARVVEAEGLWQPHLHGGYHPVAVDITAFYRPRLAGCPTSHYHATAGKALPAIPVGIIARIGSVARQRFGLPRGLVRADPKDPSPSAHRRVLLERAVELQEPTDVLVTDRELVLSLPKDGAAPGSQGNGLGNPAPEERDRAAGRAASVWGAGTPTEVWGGGAPARTAARRARDRRDPTGSGHELDRARQRSLPRGTRGRPDSARRAVDGPGAARCRPRQPALHHPSASSGPRSTTRPTPSPCWWRRPSRCRHRSCASCTVTVGRSSNSPWRPSKCWAWPASSCTSRRPANASRSLRCWPGRS